MDDRLQAALLFGAGWAVLALLVAHFVFKAREHKNNQKLTLCERRLRRHAFVAALVSTPIGTVVMACGPDKGTWFIGPFLALISELLIVMVALISYDDPPQSGPPMTGYRPPVPADRDGPHT